MKRYLTCVLALAILGAVVYWVSLTGGLPEPWGTRIGQNLSRAGHFLYLLLAGLFLFFGPLRPREKRTPRALWSLGAVLLNFVVVETLKHTVFWARPVDLTSSVPRGSGFPSGHTVPDFLIAVVLGYVEPRLQIPALIMAGLVGYSRAEVTAHFPLQVWISALIGILLGLFWTHLWSFFSKEKPSTEDIPLARP